MISAHSCACMLIYKYMYLTWLLCGIQWLVVNAIIITILIDTSTIAFCELLKIKQYFCFLFLSKGVYISYNNHDICDCILSIITRITKFLIIIVRLCDISVLVTTAIVQLPWCYIYYIRSNLQMPILHSPFQNCYLLFHSPFQNCYLLLLFFQ